MLESWNIGKMEGWKASSKKLESVCVGSPPPEESLFLERKRGLFTFKDKKMKAYRGVAYA